jgi:hypothetical protein
MLSDEGASEDTAEPVFGYRDKAVASGTRGGLARLAPTSVPG